MTSRSGRDGLARRGEFVALRLLPYLESLPDLLLRTEAVDAVSSEKRLKRTEAYVGEETMVAE